MQRGKRKTVLTIAGSDPTGGAGIQADLRTLNALGLDGVSVIAAVTAQDASGVRGVFPVAPEAFSLQLQAILEDYEVEAVKTGMLLTAGNVRIAARFLKQFRPRVLVIDPVFASSNGVCLLDPEARRLMTEDLFSLATVVTPNLSEAQAISGLERSRDEGEEEWIRRMCRGISGLGPQSVVITGGHRTGEPADLLFDGREFTVFSSGRESADLHGSGCVFSSALCGYLTLGQPLAAAVSGAKEFTLERFQEK